MRLLTPPFLVSVTYFTNQAYEVTSLFGRSPPLQVGEVIYERPLITQHVMIINQNLYFSISFKLGSMLVSMEVL